MPDPLYDMINDLPAEGAADLDDALFAETRPAVTRKVTGQALADYVNGQLAEKPLATAGVKSVLGLDGDGAVVRMPTNGCRSVFPIEADIANAFIPMFVTEIQTTGYHLSGDGGGHRKIRRSTPLQIEQWHTQSADGAWWEICEKIVSPRFFGAKEDGTDTTSAFIAAIRFGAPVSIDGHFVAYSKIIGSGSVSFLGNGRALSSITWPATATDGGIEISATSYSEVMRFESFACYVGADLSAGNVLSVSWQGLGLSNYFKKKFHANNLHIEAIGDGRFNRGIYLNFVHSAFIEKCFIQNQVSLSSIVETEYPMNSCVYFDNDESLYNTVGVQMHENSLFGAKYGVFANDIEAFWFSKNDIQACWNGIHFHNGYRKVNQYRISENHIGVYDTAIHVFNARQVHITTNDLSYRTGRTDFATVHCIILERVNDGEILGNTIRGNFSNSAGSITLNGAKMVGTSEDSTMHIRLDGNGFRDLMTAIVQGIYTSKILVGPSNTYNNILDKRFSNAIGPGSNSVSAMGSGTLDPILGQNHALFLSNAGSSAFGINRESTDGAVALFYRDRVMSGFISVTPTSTSYTTISDYRLKSEIADLQCAGDVIDALKPRQFRLAGVLQAGFIAHEFAEIFPLSVIGDKDKCDTDGTPILQTMQAGTCEVIANIVAELQSLRRRISLLEVEIA